MPAQVSCEAAIHFADTSFLPIRYAFDEAVQCQGLRTLNFTVPKGAPNGYAQVVWCVPTPVATLKRMEANVLTGNAPASSQRAMRPRCAGASRTNRPPTADIIKAMSAASQSRWPQ